MGKINLNKNHRATMFSALGAFVLSMLIGLFSGNPVVVVFVRAIVSALLFSAVVFGALYLLRRYIPEFEEGTVGDDAAHAAGSGNGVNYNVSGEGSAQKRTAETGDVSGVGEPSTAESALAFGEGTESNPAGDVGAPPPVNAAISPEMAARLQGAAEASAESLQALADIDEMSSLNGLEEITLSGVEENGSGDFEDLPSLDKLYEEHEQVSVPDIGTSDIGLKSKAKNVGDYIEVGNARIPFEPEVLAKAVKKVMKEDE